MEIEVTTTEPYQDFLFALNSPVTRERYSTRLRSFFVYIGIEGTTMEERCRRFVEKVKESEENGDSKWGYACVVNFLQHQKDRCDKKEIAGSTVRGYYKAIKLFTEVNDILISWSKMKRGLPRGRHYADDRISTLDEIRKLIEYSDRRMKAIIYTMASSGIRLGAWDYLKWSHIKPIIRNDQAIAARITEYAGENEQYHSYITPEALKALLEWMDYLKPLVQDLGMHDVISRLDPRDRWTHWWESKNIASQMDYILLSPKLADNSPAKPYIERRGISNKRKKFSYLNFRAEENKIPFNFNRFNDVSDEFEASDHCPVFFELKL